MARRVSRQTTKVIKEHGTPIDCDLAREIVLDLNGTAISYSPATGALLKMPPLQKLKMLQWNFTEKN